MNSFKIVWSANAKKSLKDIFEYYRDKSPQGAVNVRTDLLKAPNKIHFAEQYQLDDINPNYRRIVVRDFKILYKVKGLTLMVIDIVSTKQSTQVLKDVK